MVIIQRDLMVIIQRNLVVIIQRGIPLILQTDALNTQMTPETRLMDIFNLKHFQNGEHG